MIKNIDVIIDGCSDAGELKACLDYPRCGYHADEDILIAGWVLPLDPLNDDVKVIIKIDDDLHHQEMKTNKVFRPDVFRVKQPHNNYPSSAMQVGFSIRVGFNNSAMVSVIIVNNGEEFLWRKIKVTVNESVNCFVNELSRVEAGDGHSFSVDDIVASTKVYFPHTIRNSHKSLVNNHLNILCDAVSSGEFIVSLYKLSNRVVSCKRTNLVFEILQSKIINDHVFLFCKGDNETVFIIHQHVTSIDGVYYPREGIYYSFCHGSQNRLGTLVDFIKKKVSNFKISEINKVAFLIGHGRPYHFLYDGMLGLEQIYQNIDEFDGAASFYTLDSNAFIDALNVYDKNKRTIIVNSNDLINLEKENIFIKIGALFGSGAKDPLIYKKIDSLDKRLREYSWGLNINSENLSPDLNGRYPIVWLGVTGQKRAWLEQIDGYSKIINKLYKYFPRMAVVFDGWTSSMVSLQRDEIESENDRKITNEIIKRIANDISMVDLVGATLDKKIYVGSFVDCAIVNYSTGSMNVSRICGRPCITHMNNSFAPARHQHIHKNAYPIPDEYVIDVVDNNRIDSTSYHIDWECIYDALVLQLGVQDIITNRR
ncbi:hypothetical protein P0W48_15785 [Plesiomonas shigelloides]